MMLPLAASSIHVTLGEVAAALALVAIAAVASRSWQAGLEEDIGIAVVRSFVQLTAIGYVITVIFDEDSFALVLVLIVVMVVFGAFTARHRAKGVPGAFSRAAPRRSWPSGVSRSWSARFPGPSGPTRARSASPPSRECATTRTRARW